MFNLYRVKLLAGKRIVFEDGENLKLSKLNTDSRVFSLMASKMKTAHVQLQHKSRVKTSTIILNRHVFHLTVCTFSNKQQGPNVSKKQDVRDGSPQGQREVITVLTSEK